MQHDRGHGRASQFRQAACQQVHDLAHVVAPSPAILEVECDTHALARAAQGCYDLVEVSPVKEVKHEVLLCIRDEVKLK